MSDDDKPLLEVVLEHYEVRVKQRSRFMTNCPLHEDQTPSMSVNLDKQVWRCHSCGEGGDVWRLLILKEETDYRGARAFATANAFATGDGGGSSGDVRGSAYGSTRSGPRGKLASRKGDRPRHGGYRPAWLRRD